MSVKRWVTQWPLDLQSVPGSSTIDWTKVEVVPAWEYDTVQAEIEKLKIELKNLAPIGRYEGHDIEWWYNEARRLSVLADVAVRDQPTSSDRDRPDNPAPQAIPAVEPGAEHVHDWAGIGDRCGPMVTHVCTCGWAAYIPRTR